MFAITCRLACVSVFVCGICVGWPLHASAEEALRRMPKVGEDLQGGQVEQLPTPHEFGPGTKLADEPSAVCCERPPNLTRINRYEVWQLYDVGHYGRFRPRVIYSAYGSFYLDDGRPYPWISNHSLDFMPYAVGP
jgi:hypothetical protein